MKHINTFKEASFHSHKLFESFDSKEEIERYLKDILLEINDKGFESNIITIDSKFYIQIYINTLDYDSRRFKYTEVKDCIDSVGDYMRSNGFSLKMIYTNNQFKDSNLRSSLSYTYRDSYFRTLHNLSKEVGYGYPNEYVGYVRFINLIITPSMLPVDVLEK